MSVTTKINLIHIEGEGGIQRRKVASQLRKTNPQTKVGAGFAGHNVARVLSGEEGVGARIFKHILRLTIMFLE